MAVVPLNKETDDLKGGTDVTLPLVIRVSSCLRECAFWRCFLAMFRLTEDSISAGFKKCMVIAAASLIIPLAGVLCGVLTVVTGSLYDGIVFFAVSAGISSAVILYLIFGSFTVFLYAFNLVIIAGCTTLVVFHDIRITGSMVMMTAFLGVFVGIDAISQIIWVGVVMVYHLADLGVDIWLYPISVLRPRTPWQYRVDAVIQGVTIMTVSVAVLFCTLIRTYLEGMEREYADRVSSAIVDLDLTGQVVKEIEKIPDHSSTLLMKNLKRVVANMKLYIKYLPSNIRGLTHSLHGSSTGIETGDSNARLFTLDSSSDHSSAEGIGDGQMRVVGSRSTELSVRIRMEKKLRFVPMTQMVVRLRGWRSLLSSSTLLPKEISSILETILDQVELRVVRVGGSFDATVGNKLYFGFGGAVPLVQHAESACRAACALQQLGLRKMIDGVSDCLKADHDDLSLSLAIGIATGRAICGNAATSNTLKWFTDGKCHHTAECLAKWSEEVFDEKPTQESECPHVILLNERTAEAAKYRFVVSQIGHIVEEARGDSFTRLYVLLGGRGMKEGEEWNYQLRECLADATSNDEFAASAWKSAEVGNWIAAKAVVENEISADVRDLGTEILREAVAKRSITKYLLEKF